MSKSRRRLDIDAESLVLHRDGDSVRAWLNVCPHAGRRLDWAPGQFLKSKQGQLVCAAHGASFESGKANASPGRAAASALRAESQWKYATARSG